MGQLLAGQQVEEREPVNILPIQRNALPQQATQHRSTHMMRMMAPTPIHMMRMMAPTPIHTSQHRRKPRRRKQRTRHAPEVGRKS
ncbi:unnamed protein product [Rotaria socialis]|uniref:Uncharacterized protein n=1 Tax=Rotaria socialis TaxID=392032 RepID=A0A817RE81_9BILA|nr:unnamed protein product [Rotaria socialis]CAF3308437.1 unnamed protein product [Rotaria socialis]CAF3437408.1 unnamed protein product [Rotaria socialis]CAF4125683.1 unnamed protein product [Rotaria socialis]CAF4229008.1 unnamed protein product [Rotaria socialis]